MSTTQPDVQADPSPAEPAPLADGPAPLTFGGFFRRLGPAGPLAVIAASAPAVAGFTLLGLMPWIAGWIKLHPDAGAILYFACYAVLGGMGFLPTYAYSILGGYAFGLREGLTLALLSYGAASVVAYLIARRASGDRVIQMIEERPKWKAVYDALLGSSLPRTLLIVTLLRLPPNSPFALTNLVMAATKVRPLPFLVGTVLGIAPRTAAVVAIGALFGLESGKPAWFLVSGVIVTLVVLAVIGQLANQAINRVTRPKETPTAAPAA